jgi:hypothetical protein
MNHLRHGFLASAGGVAVTYLEFLDIGFRVGCAGIAFFFALVKLIAWLRGRKSNAGP